MRYLLFSALLLSMAALAPGRTRYDTLIYTHDLHEQKYKVGNCDVCHVNILKSKKSRDDNYADDQSCNKTGCHDIKDQDSCFVCHTNAKAKTPKKPRREIKFSHKIHAGLNKLPVNGPEIPPGTTSSSSTENDTVPSGAKDLLLKNTGQLSGSDSLGTRDSTPINRPLIKMNRNHGSYKALQEIANRISKLRSSTGKSGAPQTTSLGIECRICHFYIDSMFYYTRKDMPSMALCLVCHQKEQANANCIHCHTDPSIILSHSAGGRADHGPLYANSPHSCETCHDNTSCGKCHSGQIAEHVHPANYLYLHSFDAQSGSTRCETCHDTRQSCDGCHQRSWGRIVDHRNAIRGTASCKSCHKGGRAR